MSDRPRTPRTLSIPDHVWLAYEQMAADMGTDRDGLVSQALFSFARLNGYLLPSDLARLSAPPPAGDGRPPAQPQVTSQARPPQGRGAMGQPTGDGGVGPTIHEQPAPRKPRNPERVAELAQQLEAEQPPPAAAPPIPTPAGGAPLARIAVGPPAAAAAPPNGSIEVDDALLGDDAVQATSMELPNLAEMGLLKRPPVATPSRPVSAAEIGAVALDEEGEAGAHGRVLVLSADGRELDRVSKDRFLIGRGKHCDLIINSGKVSREHAAITREGNDFFIEDLGSSNGTWFDKRRITKRQIQEGDDYFICAEKLSCSFA
jgi:hypothetical protein